MRHASGPKVAANHFTTTKAAVARPVLETKSMKHDETKLNDPWLVAVWPGMGKVAVVAANYLLRELDAEPLGPFQDEEFFGTNVVRIRSGIVSPELKPRGQLFAVRNTGGRDLLVFVSEEQPDVRGHAYCDRLLDLAAEHGVQRVVTFAALVTPTQPSAPSRVFAVASRRELLEELARTVGTRSLADGELVGLNGTLLARAAARGLDAMGLLAEVPALAAGVPYLKAAASVLDVLRRVADLDLDLAEIHRQAEAFERNLESLLGQLQALQEGAAKVEPEGSFATQAEFRAPSDEEEEDAERAVADSDSPEIDPAVFAQIEALFLKAQQDRRAAYELKERLDDYGLFDRYEDRFLDLFSPKGEENDERAAGSRDAA
ncbi:MAG: hypothetical protein D6731_09180 [Planctomycetota bacterium]|nr:MAG: hypothetical protein D6731_09180 [Planctomycetota bacterium]